MQPKKQAPGPRPKHGHRPRVIAKTTVTNTGTDINPSIKTNQPAVLTQSVFNPIKTKTKPIPTNASTENQNSPRESQSQRPIHIGTETLFEVSSVEADKLNELIGENDSYRVEASSNNMKKDDGESEVKKKKKKKVVKKMVKMMVKKIVKKKVPKIVHKEENGDRDSGSLERMEFRDGTENLEIGDGSVGINNELGRVGNRDVGDDLVFGGLESFDKSVLENLDSGDGNGGVSVGRFGSIAPEPIKVVNNDVSEPIDIADNHVVLEPIEVADNDVASKPIEVEDNDVVEGLPIEVEDLTIGGFDSFNGQVGGSASVVERTSDCDEKVSESRNVEKTGFYEGVEVGGLEMVMENLDSVCGNIGPNDGKIDSLALEPSAVENAVASVNLPIEGLESFDNCMGASMEIEHEKMMEVSGVVKEDSVSEVVRSGGGTEGVMGKPDSISKVVEGMGMESIGVANDDDTRVIADENDEHSEGEDGENEGKMEEKVNNRDVHGGGIVLSAELEALERQRKRKTEIFVRGLNVNAKEEDVKKVFEEVGEVVEVRLTINSTTGKNKGFAFVRYASATNAKKALEKFAKVEICGKQCTTAEVKGKDTIFLGHIDKKWKNEDIINMLQEMGINNIDTVTVIADPNNTERNRGFAFLELATYKDAHIAFNKLQKKGALGKLKNVKVAWAEPLSQPDEEELLKVKSVYAEYLPTSWKEENVRSFFEKFGDIDSIALARNLPSSRRNDFAFVNFQTREAALACIDSFNCGKLNDEGSKMNIKVSLAKPLRKGKTHGVNQVVSKSAGTGATEPKLKAGQRLTKPSRAGKQGASASYNQNERTSNIGSIYTSGLETRLAERALYRQMQERLGTGKAPVNYSSPIAGRKRPFSSLEDAHQSVSRPYPPMHMQSSFPVRTPSVHNGVHLGAALPPPYYHQQQKGSNHRPSYSYSSNPNNPQPRKYQL